MNDDDRPCDSPSRTSDWRDVRRRLPRPHTANRPNRSFDDGANRTDGEGDDDVPGRLLRPGTVAENRAAEIVPKQRRPLLPLPQQLLRPNSSS